VQLRARYLAGLHLEGIEVSLGAQVPWLPVVRLRGDQQFAAHHQGVEAHLDRQIVELGDVVPWTVIAWLVRPWLVWPWLVWPWLVWPWLVWPWLVWPWLLRPPPSLQQPEQLMPDGRLEATLGQLDDLALHSGLKLVPRFVVGAAREVAPERIACISLVKRHWIHRSFSHDD
jgi:hypothetical protein